MKPMTRISITSSRNARKHGKPKAYLALLKPGLRGSIARDFFPTKKLTGGTDGFFANAKPGEIYELRRWRWDQPRAQFVGGTDWIGIQADGSPEPLTREEAFAAILVDRIDSDRQPEHTPDKHRAATRMLPDDISWRVITESNEADANT